MKITEWDSGLTPETAIGLGLNGLPDLVVRGYGFPIETTSQQFKYEYGEDGKLMFFAIENGIVVASLVMSHKPNILGKTTFGVSGIVTHPDHLNHGYAYKLLSHAVEKLQPELIVGQTKTPSVLRLRQKLKEYTTYYGQNNLITGEKDGTVIPYLNAYIATKCGIEPDGNYVYTVSIDTLPPTVPDVKCFSNLVQVAFTDVIEKQLELDTVATAVMPIISIKNKYEP